MAQTSVTIGEAANLTGLTAKAIRLYESRGLIAPTARTSSGYRTYGTDDLDILRFIRQAKAIGLSLTEIGQVIDLQRSEGQPCAMVIDLLDLRLADLDRTLVDLQSLRDALGSARSQAEEAMRSGNDAVVCTVIESAGR